MFDIFDKISLAAESPLIIKPSKRFDNNFQPLKSYYLKLHETSLLLKLANGDLKKMKHV